MELYIELSLAEFDSLLLNNSISDNSILSSAAGSRQAGNYLPTSTSREVRPA